MSQGLPANLSRPRMNGIYPRGRLFDTLSAAGTYAAVWINGPAGSRKTTAVNSYLEDRGLPCLWYTLDEGDTDIASFCYYLRRAAKAYCQQGADPPPPLSPDYFPSIATFAKRFFEAFFTLFPAPFCLVFDDYHEVFKDSSLHEMLCNAILQTPNHIHLYVISRLEPPVNTQATTGTTVRLAGMQIVIGPCEVRLWFPRE